MSSLKGKVPKYGKQNVPAEERYKKPSLVPLLNAYGEEFKRIQEAAIVENERREAEHAANLAELTGLTITNWQESDSEFTIELSNGKTLKIMTSEEFWSSFEDTEKK